MVSNMSNTMTVTRIGFETTNRAHLDTTTKIRA